VNGACGGSQWRMGPTFFSNASCFSTFGSIIRISISAKTNLLATVRKVPLCLCIACNFCQLLANSENYFSMRFSSKSYKKSTLSVCPSYCLSVFSTRCNIYISRLCYDVSVRLSVRLSVTEVHWRIIANLGFKVRSHFTAHCGCRAARRAACGRIISRHASQC